MKKKNKAFELRESARRVHVKHFISEKCLKRCKLCTIVDFEKSVLCQSKKLETEAMAIQSNMIKFIIRYKVDVAISTGKRLPVYISIKLLQINTLKK
jgi:hypothetical protein